MSHYKTLLSTLALTGAALLTACSSTPVATNDAAADANAAQAKSAESAVAPVVVPAYLDPKNPLSTQQSVYFDFDKYELRKDGKPVVDLHGKFLAGNGAVAIRVEGNADERGSSEYNLALGQKRADTVVRALKTFGVKDSQMEAVSFGKEKPKAQGHNEAAWAQNRRVDLRYPTK